MRYLIAIFVIAGLAGAAGAAEKAQARIVGTDGSPVNGTVRLEETKGGLKIDAELTQAPPGLHGFHIHEFGSCDNKGEAAGSHYNPDKHSHGDLQKGGVGKAHAGDFGNITVDPTGQGSYHAMIEGVSLDHGKRTVAGRAFVLHEKADDFGQPTGNAGGRIACGPILIIKE